MGAATPPRRYAGPMLEKIITGGQSGADLAGWYAAKAHGLPTGGAMPRGFLTEDGPRPDYATLYGAVELESDDYKSRTRRNVADSDGTLWLGDYHSPGGRATLDACRLMGKPFLIVQDGVTTPGEVRDWVVERGIRTLNVAGVQECSSPGIGDRVERFLGRVLRQLGIHPVG